MMIARMHIRATAQDYAAAGASGAFAHTLTPLPTIGMDVEHFHDGPLMPEQAFIMIASHGVATIF